MNDGSENIDNGGSKSTPSQLARTSIRDKSWHSPLREMDRNVQDISHNYCSSTDDDDEELDVSVVSKPSRKKRDSDDLDASVESRKSENSTSGVPSSPSTNVKTRNTRTSDSPSNIPKVSQPRWKHIMRRETNNLRYSSMLYIICPLVLVIFSCYFYFPSPSSDIKTCDQINSSERFEKFRKNLKSFQALYPNQEKSMWTKVAVAVRENLHKNPRQDYPAILLLAYDEKNDECLKNFINDIGTAALDSSCSNETVTHLNVASFAEGTRDMIDEKQKFDDFIHEALSGDTFRVLAIHGIERMSSEVALLLHRYCDDQHAPFKRSLIILTLDLSDIVKYDDNNEQSVETLMSDKLSRVWNNPPKVTRDQIYPIFTRIAGYNALWRTSQTCHLH